MALTEEQKNKMMDIIRDIPRYDIKRDELWKHIDSFLAEAESRAVERCVEAVKSMQPIRSITGFTEQEYDKNEVLKEVLEALSQVSSELERQGDISSSGEGK